MSAKPGNPRMRRPADQIKLRLVAKAPDKVDKRAIPFFNKMHMEPPKTMSRELKLSWYAKRITDYEWALNKIADDQGSLQMVFSREARESRSVEDAMTRMIPDAKRIFQMELQLHRMEMYKTMLRHNLRVEMNPLDVEKEKKRTAETERVIRSYGKVEKDMIEVLNNPSELVARTRQMIVESRKRK